jgi:hypothetical protein
MQRAYCKPFAAILVCLTLFASALLPGSALAAPAVPDHGASVNQAGPYAVSSGRSTCAAGRAPATVLGTLALNELSDSGVSPDSAWYINTVSEKVAGVSGPPILSAGACARPRGDRHRHRRLTRFGPIRLGIGRH